MPDGIRVDFVKSEFAGLLPGHFSDGEGGGDNNEFWWRKGTRRTPEGLNDLNREEPRYYVCCLRPWSFHWYFIHTAL